MPLGTEVEAVAAGRLLTGQAAGLAVVAVADL